MPQQGMKPISVIQKIGVCGALARYEAISVIQKMGVCGAPARYETNLVGLSGKCAPNPEIPQVMTNDSAVVTGSVSPSPEPDQDTHFYNQSAPQKPPLDLRNMKYFYFLEQR